MSGMSMLESPAVRHCLSLVLVSVAVLLAGCDAQRIEKLEEGLATEADVREQFGEPVQIVEKADGSKLLAYPRQPEGFTNYEIVIGADGKMASLRQLLTPANMARVQPGQSQDAVRRLLGPQAKTQRYAMKPDQTVWRWHFLDGQAKKDFEATFDRDGRVLSTAISDDERQTMAGGK
jgi:hypothetical protein